MTQAEEKRLHERLDKIIDSLSQVSGTVQAIEASCIPCKQSVVRQSKAIWGNGSGGLVRQVITLEEVQTAQVKTIADMQNTKGKAFWELIRLMSAIVAAVFAVLATHYMSF